MTCVIVPNDIQEAQYSEPPRAHGAVPSSIGFLEPVIRPRDEDLRRAADLLNAGQRVAMLIGQGAIGAEREVVEVADLLGAGVAKALNGRAAVPDDLPFVTGPIGLLGSKPTYDMMEGCDTLLMVGSSFPYSEWLPEFGQARGVQVDIDGRLVGMRYPMEINLVGDSGETLRTLVPLLRRQEDRSWRAKIEDDVRRWWEVLDAQAHESADPLNPQLLFHELSKRLPDLAILTSDSGSSTDWWARHMRLRSGMKTALSGTLATMCPAIPYALAAKFAYPDRPVIASIGDGAFQMLGVNALIDIARYRDRWANQQLVVLVLHNDDLNQVTWEQRVMSGDPKLEVSQTLPDFPYARYAELIGLKGIRVDSPDAVVRPGTRRWCRAARRDRGDHRSGGPTAAAPHPLRTGQGACPSAARRPGARSDRAPVAQGDRRRLGSPLSMQALARKRPLLARLAPPRGGVARWLWNLRAGRVQKTLADRRRERPAARVRDVPRALQGVVRRHLDVEPDRDQPARQRRRSRRGALEHGGADRTAGGRGRVRGQWGDRNLHPPAGVNRSPGASRSRPTTS